MKFQVALLAVATALFSLVAAHPSPASPASRPLAQGIVNLDKRNRRPLDTYKTYHHVQVGGDSIFQFTPGYLFTQPGDIITFEFLKLNHTVTQSDFWTPCSFLTGGIDSGYIPNPQGVPGQYTYDVEIPDGDSYFFYCKQGKHCSNNGMVFVVNPSVTYSFTEFFSRAKGLIA